jgi:hypothetical protein
MFSGVQHKIFKNYFKNHKILELTGISQAQLLHFKCTENNNREVKQLAFSKVSKG